MTGTRTTTPRKARKPFDAKKFDEEITKRNIKNHEALAFGIVALVAKNSRIESEIVHNYLKRTDQLLIDGKKSRADFARKYPQFAKYVKERARAS